MTYILTKDRTQNSFEEWQTSWSNYLNYIETVKDALPRAAFEFASAPWHYDFSDHRAPHDGWVEEVLISEPSSGEREQIRSVELFVRLFAAYHDGHIELKYSDLHSYSLTSGLSISSGHGDWLYDEIRLSDDRHVLHEVEWSSGGLWLIDCGDVSYRWIPLSSIEAAS